MRPVQNLYCAMFALATGSALSGQAVLILLATRLGLPEAWTSSFGAFPYIGFLFVPITFMAVSRFGASHTMGVQQFIQALCVLSVSMLALFSFQGAACVLFILALLINILGSMSNSMYYSLQKEMLRPDEMPQFFAYRSYISFGGSFISLVFIAWYLKHFTAMRHIGILLLISVLLLSVCAVCYYTMGDFPRLKQNFSKSLLPSIKEAMKFRAMRRQLAIGVVQNLALMCLMPNCILALRNGLGVSETQIMIFNSLEIGVAIIAAYFYKKAAVAWGPRNCMLKTYPLLLCISAFWWLVPGNAPIAVFAIPPIIYGVMSIFYSMAMANYFTISIPPSLQMPGTFLLLMIHGVIPGFLGIILNPLLHKAIRLFTYQEPLTPYRIYFTIYIVFYIGCVILGKYMPKHLHQEAQ